MSDRKQALLNQHVQALKTAEAEAATDSESNSPVFTWLEKSKVGPILLIVLPISIPLSFILIVRVFGWQAFDLSTSVSLLVAFSVCLASILGLQFMIRQMRSLRIRIISEIKSHNSDLTDDIDTKLSTTITPLNGKAMLQEALAEAYRSATLLSKTEGSKFANDKSVIYFGAADISPSAEEFREAEARDDYSESDVARFDVAFSDMVQSGIRLTRYVRFFEIPIFGRRSSQLRADYIAWLSTQIRRLEEQPNYRLINTRRAPRWKSPRNFIIAADTYLDIGGGGNNGFKVRGAEFCENILESTMLFINERHEDEDSLTSYSRRNISSLKDMLSRLEKFHQDRLIEEAQNDTGA